MSDIRSEIRAEFEREQAAFPPPSDLRPRFAEAAAAQRRGAVRLQWLAAVAVLLIATLVVAALVSSRIAARRTVPAATPGAPTDYGPPPAGVNLIWVHDRQHPTWLVGYDWTGEPRGTIKPDAAGLVMAPDGQSFSTGVSAKGGHWRFYDRLGNPVAADEVGNVYNVRYADDNQHVCAMTQDLQTFGYTLWQFAPGGALKSVGEITRDGALDQTTVVLASCSFRNDRAIAYRISVSAVTEAWIVRISDGVVLAHHIYPKAIAILLGSADAKYLAEASGDEPIVIRRVADWEPVATVATGVNPLAFSGDDTRLVVASLYDTQGGVMDVHVVDWGPGGGPVWALRQTGNAAVAVLPEPGGQHFVIGVPVAGSSDPLLDDVTIVAGDGTAAVLGRFDIAF